MLISLVPETSKTSEPPCCFCSSWWPNTLLSVLRLKWHIWQWRSITDPQSQCVGINPEIKLIITKHLILYIITSYVVFPVFTLLYIDKLLKKEKKKKKETTLVTVLNSKHSFDAVYIKLFWHKWKHWLFLGQVCDDLVAQYSCSHCHAVLIMLIHN